MNSPNEKTAAKNRLSAAPALAGAILLQSAALLFSKKAGLASAGKGLVYVAANPWYAAVIAALVLQAVCWISVLRRMPVSLAYPFMSLVFPVNLLLAYFMFGEGIQANHIAGVCLVIFGVAVIARETRA